MKEKKNHTHNTLQLIKYNVKQKKKKGQIYLRLICITPKLERS